MPIWAVPEDRIADPAVRFLNQGAFFTIAIVSFPIFDGMWSLKLISQWMGSDRFCIFLQDFV
jgi:hypothetical protein